MSDAGIVTCGRELHYGRFGTDVLPDAALNTQEAAEVADPACPPCVLPPWAAGGGRTDGARRGNAR